MLFTGMHLTGMRLTGMHHTQAYMPLACISRVYVLYIQTSYVGFIIFHNLVLPLDAPILYSIRASEG
jgi:hypothetical protein